MPIAGYVRVCGTTAGYRSFVREDEVRQFVQSLSRLPDWLASTT
jgi:hypothetical protein